MSTINFISVPSKRLAASITAASLTIQLNDILGWDSVALASSDFGTKLYAVLRNDANTLMEIIELDPATIASASITVLRRGLKFTGDLTTEVTANKLTWIKNETIVELGTDSPQLLNHIVRTIGDQDIDGVKTFSSIPKTTGGNATADNELVRLAQLNAAALGTTNINRVVIAGTAGETLIVGNLVYLKESDGRWWKCDADTAATVDNIVLGIAQGAGSAGVAITSGVLTYGLDSNQTGLTANTIAYASNTAGGIVSATPGTVEVTLGYSTSTTSIFFAPRYNQTITEDQQDALGGSSSTPSLLNKYETADDVTGVLDISQLIQNGTLKTGEADATGKQNLIAQSFVATRSSIPGVQLHKLADSASFTGTFKVALQADSAGSPSGSDLASVTISNAAYLAMVAGVNGFIFSSAYASVIGTTYWIVITCSTSDNTNHPNLGYDTATVSGVLKYKNVTDGWVALTGSLTMTVLQTVASKVLRRDSNGSGLLYGTDLAASGTVYSASIPGVISLYTGLRVAVKLNTTNTGASTININNLGAIAIKKFKGQALIAGDILTGQIIDLEYDGTNFQLQSVLGHAPSSLIASSGASGTVSGASLTTEQTIFTTTVPGNTLGTTMGVEAKLFINGFRNDAGTCTIRLYYGTSVIATFNFTQTDSASSGFGTIDMLVMANAATNAQRASLLMRTFGVVAQDNVMPEAMIQYGSTTATEDSTADKVFKLTIQWGTTDANNSLAWDNYYVRSL